MKTVNVALPGRDYDVHIGAGLIEQAGALVAPLLRRPKVAVVMDEQVAKLHGARLHAGLDAEGVEVDMLSLPSGEGTKDWSYLGEVVEWLLSRKVERNDIVIAFGGGVIGDLVGFAAAILRRGVRFVQIPTTLLAQVDSSVGGKTGVNSAHGKNLIGAFHQPSMVLADTALLSTLPDRDFYAGYGEVVKYGLLGDADFYDWLESNGPHLRRDQEALLEAVARCVAMKARIVERDETERGERALLNLGHTFGHALEAATGYSSRLLHGEGVAIGCALAFALSARIGLCEQAAADRVVAHLKTMGMPSALADIKGDLPDGAGLLALMAQDKKVTDDRLRFILARGIGRTFITDDVAKEDILAVLDQSRKLARQG